MENKEKKIHNMFDSLFKEAGKSPQEYISYVISAGDNTKNRNEIWWKNAVKHAVNSGGELWQSSYERIELFEKYGLNTESPAEQKLLNDCYSQYQKYMKTYGFTREIVDLSNFKEDIYSNKSDMIEYLQGNEKLLEKYRNKEDLKDSRYEKLS